MVAPVVWYLILNDAQRKIIIGGTEAVLLIKRGQFDNFLWMVAGDNDCITKAKLAYGVPPSAGTISQSGSV